MINFVCANKNAVPEHTLKDGEESRVTTLIRPRLAAGASAGTILPKPARDTLTL